MQFIKQLLNRNKRKMHVYHQLEFSDCGYACIRMICRYYGWRISSDYLKEITDYNRLGLSIAEVRRTFINLGFNCEAVKVNTSELDRIPLPAILFWKSKHFVVLENIETKSVVVIDPVDGRKNVSYSEFIESFITTEGFGIVLVMEPTEEFYIKRNSVNRYESKNGLLKFLKQSIEINKRPFFQVLLLSIITLIADISIPFLFQRTIDDGIKSEDISLVWLLIIGQLLIFLGSYISNSLIEILLTKLGLKLSIEMLDNYLYKLVRLPMTFFAQKVSSDLIQKIEDHTRIKNFILTIPNILILSVLSILVFSSLLLYFCPYIFMIFMIFTLGSVGWTSFFLNYRRDLDSSVVSKVAENRNNLYELIDGINEIKSNNAHIIRVKIWKNLQEQINKLSIKSTFCRLYQTGGNTLLIRLRDIIIMGVSACFVIDDTITIGIMMTISYIVGRLSIPFNSFFNTINDIQDANLSFQRIEEIHNTEIIEPKDEENLKIEHHPIIFSNVSFKYPGASSPLVLKNIELKIEIKKTTALVGKSGCGKSTIIKLLSGFYAPSCGKISIGNIDMKEIETSQWIRKIAVVLQDGKIFSGSILANIALSEEVPDTNKVKKAAKNACIDDFIESLPLKYGTRIGKTGLDLSGGQQQRILLARALYRDPDILILDEATSSMDAITESRIMQNIYSIFKNKTLIIAAHRLSTIKNSDNIIVLDNGKIVETGKHQSLLKQKGVYSNLVNDQLKS